MHSFWFQGHSGPRKNIPLNDWWCLQTTSKASNLKVGGDREIEQTPSPFFQPWAWSSLMLTGSRPSRQQSQVSSRLLQQVMTTDHIIFLNSGKMHIHCIIHNKLQWAECLCPLKTHVEILTPHNVMVLGGGAWGRDLGHEDGILINEIRPLIKGTPQGSLYHIQQRSWHSATWRGLSTMLAPWSWTSSP